MFSPDELNKLGERISKDFLEHGTPLTEGLEKVASEAGLNRNQVDRVAEAANVKTHLDLLRSGKDTYVVFDVADPETVKTATFKKPEENMDYNYKPSDSYEEDLSPFKLAGYEPSPDIEIDQSLQKYKDAVQKEAEVDQLHNLLLETSSTLEELQYPMYSLCKQAALGGTPAEDLQLVIKEASGDFSDFIIDEVLKGPLNRDGIDFSIKEKTASKKVNPENELFKATQDFCEEAFFGKNISDVLQEKIAELNSGESLIEKRAARKYAGVIGTIGGVLKGAINTIINYPKTTLAGGAYYLGRQGAKQREKTQHLPKQIQKSIHTRPQRSQPIY